MMQYEWIQKQDTVLTFADTRTTEHISTDIVILNKECRGETISFSFDSQHDMLCIVDCFEGQPLFPSYWF